MAKLSDLGPLSEEVPISGNRSLTVFPISAEGFFMLMGKYEEIKMILEGRGRDIDPKKFMDIAPDTVAGVIATAVVDREDFDTAAKWKAEVNKAIPKIRKMSVADQLNIVQKVFELTFTEGPVPFVEKIKALAVGLNQGAEMVGQVTQGTTPGKAASSTASRSRSKPAVNLGTYPGTLMRGTIAPSALVRGTHKSKDDGRLMTHDFWPSQGQPTAANQKTSKAS